MPNIATALKEEISRIARKELKGEVERLRKSAIQQRKDIAALKRQLAGLEKAIKVKSRGAAKGAATDDRAGGEDGSPARRFSATRLAAQRKKLGLSADDFGKLIGASGQSVYKWESGNTRPRAAQLEAIAKARELGKRDIAGILGA